jgi:hypothetical protein
MEGIIVLGEEYNARGLVHVFVKQPLASSPSFKNERFNSFITRGQ